MWSHDTYIIFILSSSRADQGAQCDCLSVRVLSLLTRSLITKLFEHRIAGAKKTRRCKEENRNDQLMDLSIPGGLSHKIRSYNLNNALPLNSTPTECCYARLVFPSACCRRSKCFGAARAKQPYDEHIGISFQSYPQEKKTQTKEDFSCRRYLTEYQLLGDESIKRFHPDRIYL